MNLTDDAYMKLLERIVKGAEYLDNPLIKEEEKVKGMALYDRLVEEAMTCRDAAL